MTDLCIVCGSEIPEGRQICPICESEGSKHNRIIKSAAGVRQERSLEEKGVQVHSGTEKRNTERSCGICADGAGLKNCCISPSGTRCQHWGKMLCTHPETDGWVLTTKKRGEALEKTLKKRSRSEKNDV